MPRFAEIRDFVLPRRAEREQAFRAEIERLGRRGLLVIAWIEIIMPLVGLLAQRVLIGPSGPRVYTLWPIATYIVLGLLTRWVAGTYWGGNNTRVVGMVSGLGAVAIDTWSELEAVAAGVLPSTSGGSGVLVVLLVGLAVLPLMPWQMLVLGALSSGLYIWWTSHAAAIGWIRPESLNDVEMQFLPVLILLCTALAGVGYRRVYSSYLSHEQALRVSEDLRRAESRTLIAQGAASMGRLAAAVSHELNSPLGTMRSAVESLRVAASRLEAADESRRRQLAALAEKLCGVLAESVTRMSDIVGRVQRVSNLDRAEVQAVDLNQLVADVTALVAGQAGDDVRIETELEELPPVPCRPQALGAAVTSLLTRAVENAGGTGLVRVSTRRAEAAIEILVYDSGPPHTASQIAHAFDPDFRVSSGRVTTGNWSVFGARRLIMEQGGDIRVDGRGGTTFRITLPLAAPPT